MSARPRPATTEECQRIWPAVKADRLMSTPEEFAAFRSEGPWRVRVTDGGGASVLDRWKTHLDVLAIRGLWCGKRFVADFVGDAASVARVQGFGRVLSPLVPEGLVGPYVSAGMHVAERIVAVQGMPDGVMPVRPPDGVRIRVGSDVDLSELERLDAACFDDFWRWAGPDLARFVVAERLAVAEAADGTLIGYTLATVSRGAATLTRLATTPASRRRGVGRALLSEAAAWASRSGAETLSLCTQEGNTASRALYEAAGLHEVHERYAFAMIDATSREGPR